MVILVGFKIPVFCQGTFANLQRMIYPPFQYNPLVLFPDFGCKLSGLFYREGITHLFSKMH